MLNLFKKRFFQKKKIKSKKNVEIQLKKLFLIKKTYKKYNINLEKVIDNYHDPKFYRKILFSKHYWTLEEDNKLKRILTGIKPHRNFRNNKQYAANIILNWLIEDLIYIILKRKKVNVVRSGSDKERKLFIGKNVEAECDLKIIPRNKNNKNIFIEVIANYPTKSGFASFWEEKGFLDLKDKKFHKLLDHHIQGNLILILGMVVAKNQFFLMRVDNNLKIKNKSSEQNFGGKETVLIDFEEGKPLLKGLNTLSIRSFVKPIKKKKK
ncbi:hypothetical protein HN385_00855 [archaeon]|jgi:hypothetical protein|nr:hypothetical protein [archaeon]MBT3451220.1 hypothetical protein [archaeon]MBT6868671.1 hypothetical protein [archaeon]MBT7193459.1 hypothetical protein [archaeon]MBT7381050.1 hypothetical protein [archaeon]